MNLAGLEQDATGGAAKGASMFGIRRRKNQPAPQQTAAIAAQPIVEHPAEFVRHQARTHGMTQRHKTLLAVTLASPLPLANALPTQTPRRSTSAMLASSPPPAAATEAAAGEGTWDSSSRA
jgi:hypothetical protein